MWWMTWRAPAHYAVSFEQGSVNLPRNYQFTYRKSALGFMVQVLGFCVHETDLLITP